VSPATAAMVGRGAGLDRSPALVVPMQDLDAHHAPLLGELQRCAARVLASGQYVQGPEVRAFEHEAAIASGVAHAVGVSSGTDALLAMLMAVGVGPGDEVVTTPFSFFATAGAIARLGARPVFADIDPRTLTLDPDKGVPRMGPRTKAVLTVDLFGRMARTTRLEEVCAARGVALVEDAAQAIGATDGAGRRVGTIGLGGALSFFPTKNLGGFGDGGMVLTNDHVFAERVRLLRVHGAASKFRHTAVGGNFRLDELQAALLRVKLPGLARWTAGRRHVARRYGAALSGLPVALPPDDPGCVWNQFVVRVPAGRRDALAEHLARHGVATAVYYPEPLHLQRCFNALGYHQGDFPVAEQACQDVLALPMFPELTDDQVEHVASTVRGFYGGAIAGR
jgi:dTDP-4-amino-4,6-dideoxygalactose transaminase